MFKYPKVRPTFHELLELSFSFHLDQLTRYTRCKWGDRIWCPDPTSRCKRAHVITDRGFQQLMTARRVSPQDSTRSSSSSRNDVVMHIEVGPELGVFRSSPTYLCQLHRSRQETARLSHYSLFPHCREHFYWGLLGMALSTIWGRQTTKLVRGKLCLGIRDVTYTRTRTPPVSYNLARGNRAFVQTSCSHSLHQSPPWSTQSTSRNISRIQSTSQHR